MWQREIKKGLVQYKLTRSEFVLMASIHWLTSQKQEVTQIALSAHTKIDPITTSTVLITLQTTVLVKRQEHETDARAKTVELTEIGLKNIRMAIKTVEQFDKQFFASLDKRIKDFNNKFIIILETKSTCNNSL
ncbi:MAG: MarR family transcriptional regulator [Taibaiella sp.]|nr:MarR family transcriptional regulator [Taibaiella sp.]